LIAANAVIDSDELNLTVKRRSGFSKAETCGVQKQSMQDWAAIGGGQNRRCSRRSVEEALAEIATSFYNKTSLPVSTEFTALLKRAIADSCRGLSRP